MAHMIESMAYNGELPWHGLGVEVPEAMPLKKMIEKAGLDWRVEKRPIQTDQGMAIPGKFALVRDKDKMPLSICSGKYVPTQNEEGIDFFQKFIKAGRMSMNTLGSLDGGKRVWALAKMNQGDFALSNDDLIEMYLLLCMPHVPGQSLLMMTTPIRVVCHNTLTMALNSAAGAEGVFRMRHNKEFDKDVKLQAEIALGLSAEQIKTFRESATFLSSKKATDASVGKYFQALYPPQGTAGENRTVDKLKECYLVQPGRHMSEGTWWSAFNAVTYYIDHKSGLQQNTRMRNSWFGYLGKQKHAALAMALEAAKRSKAA